MRIIYLNEPDRVAPLLGFTWEVLLRGLGQDPDEECGPDEVDSDGP